MPADDLDPKLEAATKEFIDVSEIIFQAIVIEARGSIRYKKTIARTLDWPEQLREHPLSEQIARHIAASHKIGTPRGNIVPNETAALSSYLEDFLSAHNVTVGNFSPHAAVFLDRRTQRTVVKKILDALLPESELELQRAEIPGIDLKRAAGFIRYGHGHKVPIPRIVYWFQQELPWDAIVTEVRYGGLPPGYPMDEGPELGGRGPQIAEVLHHSIDSDLGLDLARIANWMETGRWPLDVSPGKIIATISEHGGKPSSRFAIPAVELFWLFGRTQEMGAWRSELRDFLHFALQNLADDAIMRPPEFESEAEVPSTPAASQLEPAATPGPAADPPTPKIHEPWIPAPLSKPLSKKLKKGKECEERAQEIATIRRLVRAEGMSIHEVRRDHPEFGIWGLVQSLPKEWKDIFDKPMEWGPAKGFANNLLAEFKTRRPSTVDGWRKAWRNWRDHEESSSKAGSSRDRKAS